MKGKILALLTSGKDKKVIIKHQGKLYDVVDVEETDNYLFLEVGNQYPNLVEAVTVRKGSEYIEQLKEGTLR